MNDDISPLPPGSKARDFTLRCTPGATLSLEALSGHHIILVFYPHDREPVSAEQLLLYQDYLPEFRSLDAGLVGISVDAVEDHEAFARDLGIGFPLLSDSEPKGMVARMYGVYRETEDMSVRAIFVVDRVSIIRYSQACPDLLNPGVNDILTALETMALLEPPTHDRRTAHSPPAEAREGARGSAGRES